MDFLLIKKKIEMIFFVADGFGFFRWLVGCTYLEQSLFCVAVVCPLSVVESDCQLSTASSTKKQPSKTNKNNFSKEIPIYGLTFFIFGLSLTK